MVYFSGSYQPEATEVRPDSYRDLSSLQNGKLFIVFFHVTDIFKL